jgi:hypothetical protein
MIQDLHTVAALTAAGGAHVELDPDKAYIVDLAQHDGTNPSTDFVVLGFTSSVGNAIAAKDGEIPLIYGSAPVQISPGHSDIYLRCASGAPLVRIVASAPWGGKY